MALGQHPFSSLQMRGKALGLIIPRNCIKSRLAQAFIFCSTYSNDIFKTGILAFIFTQDYVSDAGFAAEKYAMFLWASADPYSEVSAAGENGLKHMIKPDFESVEVLKAFYRMYQGGGKDIKAMVNPLTGVDKDDSHHRVPASSAVKLRLLNSVFTKSKAACLQPFFPRFVHVAFDAVFAEKTLKVQLAGMAFLLWILQNAKQEIIETFVGASVLAAVPQLVGRKAHSQPSALRAAAYEVLGSLARRAPPLFSDDFKMIKELFGALDSETDDSVRFSIQSCLMSMTSAFKADVGSMSEQRKQQIEMVLLENAAKVSFHLFTVLIGMADVK